MITMRLRVMIGGQCKDRVVERIKSIFSHNLINCEYEQYEDNLLGMTMGINGNCEYAKSLVGKLGDPLWVHEWKEIVDHCARDRHKIEIVIDSRKSIFVIPEIYWCYIYAENKTPRDSAQQGDAPEPATNADPASRTPPAPAR